VLEAAKPLARVLRNYNAFYVQHQCARQEEALQYELLVSLMKLFRELGRRDALGGDFIFRLLMPKDPGSFGAIFPERLHQKF
jgi:hypothetical protein